MAYGNIESHLLCPSCRRGFLDVASYIIRIPSKGIERLYGCKHCKKLIWVIVNFLNNRIQIKFQKETSTEFKEELFNKQ